MSFQICVPGETHPILTHPQVSPTPVTQVLNWFSEFDPFPGILYRVTRCRTQWIKSFHRNARLPTNLSCCVVARCGFLGSEECHPWAWVWLAECILQQKLWFLRTVRPDPTGSCRLVLPDSPPHSDKSPFLLRKCQTSIGRSLFHLSLQMGRFDQFMIIRIVNLVYPARFAVVCTLIDNGNDVIWWKWRHKIFETEIGTTNEFWTFHGINKSTENCKPRLIFLTAKALDRFNAQFYDEASAWSLMYTFRAPVLWFVAAGSQSESRIDRFCCKICAVTIFIENRRQLNKANESQESGRFVKFLLLPKWRATQHNVDVTDVTTSKEYPCCLH